MLLIDCFIWVVQVTLALRESGKAFSGHNSLKYPTTLFGISFVSIGLIWVGNKNELPGFTSFAFWLWVVACYVISIGTFASMEKLKSKKVHLLNEITATTYTYPLFCITLGGFISLIVWLINFFIGL